MIENESPLNETDKMINNFIEECEREAAKLEITVDIILPSLSFDNLGFFLYNYR